MSTTQAACTECGSTEAGFRTAAGLCFGCANAKVAKPTPKADVLLPVVIYRLRAEKAIAEKSEAIDKAEESGNPDLAQKLRADLREAQDDILALDRVETAWQQRYKSAYEG